MKLTFLGTGTSVGVPQMRCRCKVCTSADPRDKRLRASAIVTLPDGRNLLIDCGPDLRTQLLRIGCPDLDAVLLTHTHYDHVGGIDDLRPYAHTAPDAHFPVYCRADVAADLRSRVPYCFAAHPYPGVPTFNIHIVDQSQPFTVGDTEVTPLPVLHGKLPIIGFRIGSLAYITDSLSIPDTTIELMRGVDTLVLNALRIDTHMSHMSLAQALEIVGKVSPGHTYLTHMSHDIGLHAQVGKILPRGVELAYDGLVVDVADE